MPRLRPDKLSICFFNGLDEKTFGSPRKYTLTHSDRTGEIFLSIGKNFNQDQIRGFYKRFLRDEVLGEWVLEKSVYFLNIYVHVSGGVVFGTASFRNKILQMELPLVLESIRYGDRRMFNNNPKLDGSQIKVYFKSSKKQYNRIEKYGKPSDYELVKSCITQQN